jgi:hypothetical protein
VLLLLAGVTIPLALDLYLPAPEQELKLFYQHQLRPGWGQCRPRNSAGRFGVTIHTLPDQLKPICNRTELFMSVASDKLFHNLQDLHSRDFRRSLRDIPLQRFHSIMIASRFFPTGTGKTLSAISQTPRADAVNVSAIC